MTASEVIAMVAEAGGAVEVTEGGDVRLKATKPLPAVVVEKVRENKACVVEFLRRDVSDPEGQPGSESLWLSPSEWQAAELNRIFEKHGTGTPGRRITAADIDRWLVRKRWTDRWSDKPFGKLRLKDGTVDSDVGAWVSEQLRRAGTRFLRVDDKNSLAIWPEQDGPEFRFAVQLAELNHLTIYSRGEPSIQRLLGQQHPGRP